MAVNPKYLKHLLDCSICLNRFNDPRMLPCQHSYCLECLESYVASNRGNHGRFHCPQCREKVPIPEGGSEQFPKHYLVNTLNDILTESALQQQPGIHMNKTPTCGHHLNQTLNWYCKTCSIPACPECIILNHTSHDTIKLSVIERACKQDMLDVSTLAVKRIEALQKIAGDVGTNKIKMEEDLDQTSNSISQKADNLCQIIRQREGMLQGEVIQARGNARARFTSVEEELETAINNTSTLKTCAETLHESSPEVAVCTVLEATVKKKQFMQEQNIPVPSVCWSTEATNLAYDYTLVDAGFLGKMNIRPSRQSKGSPTENITLKAPINTKMLAYTGVKGLCGIGPIHKGMVCIVHRRGRRIWVYDGTGHLKGTVTIPGIERLFGLVATHPKEGKLALVDGTQRKVHFVTLSRGLEIRQHNSTCVSVVGQHLTMGNQQQLVVNSANEKTFVVLNTSGEVLFSFDVPISNTKFFLRCGLQTESGFVICDDHNEKVYFADVKGRILHTSDDCKSPQPAVQATWGRVLIPDCGTGHIKVFGEDGSFLGRIQGSNGPFADLRRLHIDEAEGVLYIGCGTSGHHQLSRYAFNPSDFQLLHMPHKVTKLTMNVQLIQDLRQYCYHS